jgi:predicted nuclease of restriction endonuclease-like (RecB) superfamily
VVQQLAKYIEKKAPDFKGYSHRNLWRMKQFYETYKDYPTLSAVLRKISWTSNLTIMSRAKNIEERAFYLRLCLQEKYNYRELERQINSGVYERAALGKLKRSALLRELADTKLPATLTELSDSDKTKLSATLTELTDSNNTKLSLQTREIDLSNSFKDSYVFEFLNLPSEHDENQLQKALTSQMKDFILELGRDFVFMAEEYPLQVGNSDFGLDLLFYHRDLQCLVGIELKTDKFKPEYLGKLNFYLEALDRDVKKPHENPSIGILLCKDQDSEVVKYALNRSLSPALVAAYETQLPDKKLLQQKLHELTAPENYGSQTG